MIELDKLGNGYERCRLWISDLPRISYDDIGGMELVLPANPSKSLINKNAAFELCVVRDISNYALVGVRFEPSNTNTLKMTVHVSRDKDKIYEDTISWSFQKAYIGIPKEYAQAILKAAQNRISRLGGFPPGTLIFDIGAHSDVGSSQYIFSFVTNTLIFLLTQNYNGQSIEEVRQSLVRDLLGKGTKN